MEELPEEELAEVKVRWRALSPGYRKQILNAFDDLIAWRQALAAQTPVTASAVSQASRREASSLWGELVREKVVYTDAHSRDIIIDCLAVAIEAAFQDGTNCTRTMDWLNRVIKPAMAEQNGGPQ